MMMNLPCSDESIFNSLEPLMPSSWNSSCVWLFKRWKIMIVGMYLRVCAPPPLPNTWKAFLYGRESQNPSRIRKLSRKHIQDRAGHVHGCPHGQIVWKNWVIGLQYTAVAAATSRPCGTGPKHRSQHTAVAAATVSPWAVSFSILLNFHAIFEPFPMRIRPSLLETKL